MNQSVTPPSSRTAEKKMTPLGWLLRLLQGMIIGVGAVLPGISGGVLCVIFGIYQPMMELLANPIKMFKKHYKMFIPILLGVGVGFLGLARLIDLLFSADSGLTTCVFIGLIIGMLPSLYREAGKEGRDSRSWTAFAAAFVILYAFFMYLKLSDSLNITPNIWWFFFCGVILGISIIVPGMSFSSTLLFMGLFQPMLNGIASFSLEAIIPIGLGALAVIALMSKMVNRLFTRHYSIASHIIFAAVLATTLPIIPFQFESAWNFILSLLCAAGGFLMAWGLDKISVKYLCEKK